MALRWLNLAIIAAGVLMGNIGRGAEGPVDYATQIKPLLRERCFACHGALQQESGLRLDTVALMKKGGDSGAVIAPGKPSDSILLQRVSATDVYERMPPEGEGEPLTAEQIAVLRAWIAAGAPAPADDRPQLDPQQHWAFQPVLRPPVPTVSRSAWNENPIDAFIARQHERHGLTPQAEVDKPLWLRRVTLDLIGLPPTREELDAFVADQSPEAQDRVITRLLESPQHGQRWGRHWMDIWRYSDWWGLGAEVRNSQKHIWHWRDWIVESVNADKGYDQMLREMLAADELYPNDFDRLRATGYLARQYFIFNRTSWLDETIEHTAKAMLGLTFNCAKCHDHKYDPFSQVEYYRLRAIFEPYQVRMEMVSGECDFEKDGIPRAFDANLDAPTYLHERGDDRHPDKSRVMEPAVPAFLSSDELQLDIEPVPLPVEAVHPGLRPFVVDAHREAAEEAIAEAREALEAAQEQLADSAAAGNQSPTLANASVVAERIALPSAAEHSQTIDPGELLFSDDFSAERPDAWERLSGQWQYEKGRLMQHQTGFGRTAIRLTARLPDDFEARLQFVPVGGETWKSVGISCDVTAEGNELLAFVSAFAGGPKAQVAYRQNGEYVYPQHAIQARDVPLHQPHELVLRVQGPLLNVLVDGELAIAHRLPPSVPRTSGHLELMTFDCTAEFLAFELRMLPSDVQLVEAGSQESESATAARMTPLPIEEARLACRIAEQALAGAEAQLASVAARAAADYANYRRSEGVDVPSLCAAAARAERLLAVARAEEQLSQAELALLRAAADKKAAAEKKLAAAKTSLDKTRAQLQTPGEAYTPLPGAWKTKEHYQDANEVKPFPATSSGRRTAFATWLTDPRHPLPARVAVNHIWTRHMGQPLVPSVFDFGLNGKPPTHPELLDWLAAEFVEHRWSMKYIHRLITTSRTYRLTSSSAGTNADTLAADPDNRFYWRMNPVRMEAQAIRDSIFYLAGELDISLGGPPIPVDEDSHRRSLYFVHSHNDHQKFLSMFDDANVLECYRRAESIVPQQALALENSALVVAMAGKITGRIFAANSTLTDAEFVREAFLTVLAYEPSEAELKLVTEMLPRLTAAARAQNRSDPETHARVAVVQALLNHNDFVTIR